MAYVACLHCERPYAKPSSRRTCSQLCKAAVDKQAAKLRLAEDRHHQATRRTPTYQLTDVECLAIEARLAGSEVLVFDDWHGFSVKDAHAEKSSANPDSELHESWADKGADLDVWQLRRVDRARFGGIVLTPELAEQMTLALDMLELGEWVAWQFRVDPMHLDREIDQLHNPEFYLKLFGFELDELYELETGDKA